MVVMVDVDGRQRQQYYGTVCMSTVYTLLLWINYILISVIAPFLVGCLLFRWIIPSFPSICSSQDISIVPRFCQNTVLASLFSTNLLLVKATIGVILQFFRMMMVMVIPIYHFEMSNPKATIHDECIAASCHFGKGHFYERKSSIIIHTKIEKFLSSQTKLLFGSGNKYDSYALEEKNKKRSAFQYFNRGRLIFAFAFLRVVAELQIKRKQIFLFFLRCWLVKVCTLGVFISSVLDGFGSVSMVYGCLAGFFLEAIDDAAIQCAEQDLNFATSQLKENKQDFL